MITRGMNIKEIIKEYETDEAEMIEQHVKVNEDKNYRRFIMQNLRGNKTWIFKPRHFKSRRGNKYMIIPVSRGYPQYKKYGLEIHTYLYYRIDDSNYYVVSQTDINNTVFPTQYGYTFYNPHFFNRYQERLVQKDIPRLELITRFFKENYEKSAMRFFNSMPEFEWLEEKYPNGYYSYGPEGITLGTISEKWSIECERAVFFANTFITRDMIKEGQKEIMESMKEVVEEWKQKEERI